MRLIAWLWVQYFIIVFTLFNLRIVTIVTQTLNTNNILEFLKQNASHIFFYGFKYDFVVAGYISALPFLIVMTCEIFSRTRLQKRVILDVTAALVFSALCLLSLIYSIDLSFFKRYSLRLNHIVLSWLNHSPKFLYTQIFSSSFYLILSIVSFLSSITISAFLMKKALLFFRKNKVLSSRSAFKRGIFMLFSLALLVVSMRGTFGLKSPLGINDTFRHSNLLASRISLNPAFTLIKTSIKNQSYYLEDQGRMSKKKALAIVQKELDLDRSNVSKHSSPLFRTIKGSVESSPKNIIHIIIQNLSTEMLSKKSAETLVTPYLNSLTTTAQYYPNVYSLSNNYLDNFFALLFGFPTETQKNPLFNVVFTKFHTAAEAFKENKISVSLFHQDEKINENTSNFLKANGYEVKKMDHISTNPKLFFKNSLQKLLENQELNIGQNIKSYNAFVFNQPLSKPKNSKFGNYIYDHFSDLDEAIKEFTTSVYNNFNPDETVIVISALNGIRGKSRNQDFKTFLIIIKPNSKAVTFNGLASTLDVMPTILKNTVPSFNYNALGKSLDNENQRSVVFYKDNDKIITYSPDFKLIERDDTSNSLIQINKDAKLKSKAAMIKALSEFTRAHYLTSEWMQNSQLTGN